MLPWWHPLSRMGPKEVVTEIDQSQVAKVSSPIMVFPSHSVLHQPWFPMIIETQRKRMVTEVAFIKQADHVSSVPVRGPSAFHLK